MNILRLGTLACTLAGAALLTGCVVAPADGVYYGDAYSTYSTGGYSYGYGYGAPYPYYGGYGGSSLVIQSSPSYIYGGGRPYYRPGGHYRPNPPHYGGNNNHSRPPTHGSRPNQVSPGTGSHIGRPIGSGSGGRGSLFSAPSRPSGGGGDRGGGRGGGWQR